MGKLTKNQKLAAEKIEAGKAYSLKEAAQLVKDITFSKFDASLDIDVRLGVDPRKANQMVRGVVSLPHGTGKQVRVLVLCTPDAEAAAKEAGADYVGLDEYIEKIKGGWTDIDVIITMPSIMGKIGALGRVLGPRGLMPNPKSGTVTMDVAKAVKEVKAKKPATRKTTKAAKNTFDKELFFQYANKQVDEETLVARIVEDAKEQNVEIKELKMYLKPEDNACYYVANGNVAGRVNLY